MSTDHTPEKWAEHIAAGEVLQRQIVESFKGKDIGELLKRYELLRDTGAAIFMANIEDLPEQFAISYTRIQAELGVITRVIIHTLAEVAEVKLGG